MPKAETAVLKFKEESSDDCDTHHPSSQLLVPCFALKFKEESSDDCDAT